MQRRQSGQNEAAGQGLSTQEDHAEVKAIRAGTTITGEGQTQEVKTAKTKQKIDMKRFPKEGDGQNKAERLAANLLIW